MPAHAHATAAPATKARALAYFFIAGSGLGFLLLAFFPLAPHTDRVGETAVLTGAAIVGIAALAGAERFPDWLLQVGVAVGTLVVSAGVAFGQGASSPGTPMFYLWVAFYAFYFFDARAAWAQLGFVGLAFAAALVSASEPVTAITQWTVTMGTLAVMGAMVAALARRLRRHERESAEQVAALREAEERFRRAFEDAAIGMALVALDGRWLRVNRALARITGYQPGELVGKGFRELTHPDDLEADLSALEEMLSGQRDGFETEKRYLHAAGHTVWIQLNVTVVRDASGRPLHLISQMQDITERKRAQAELAHQALHDPLTGLPNRVLFLDRLGVSLARLGRRDTGVAVLFLDLDRFKLINDSHGHDAGDRVLVEVAARLRALLRPSDTLARLGGDEFTILCEDVADEGAAAAVAERVAATLGPPVMVDDAEAYLSASIGIAVGRDPGMAPAALLRDADAAMYGAKERGRSRYAMFDGAMRLRGAERLRAEADLRRAVERGELRVHYQPQVDLASGRPVGVEALVRWAHPERGLVPPGEFVPVAEETGLIVAIGEWVLRQACRQARAWEDRTGDHSLRMAVNLSARQLADDGLRDVVAEALADSGLAPDRLCLEITESAVSEDPLAARQALIALRRLGVRLAIDDFGVGFSSLGQIRQLPAVDVLKIDRSFIGGLGRNREDAAIVASVISLADALGLTTVGEGVETSDHARELRALGCEQAQGFYFGRPAPPDAAGKLLAAGALGELRA